MDRSIENPQLFLQTNILGTQCLLDAARAAWVMGRDAAGYPTWRSGVWLAQPISDVISFVVAIVLLTKYIKKFKTAQPDECTI